MADKIIFIDNLRVGYATKATMKYEITTEETDTFDGKVVDGDPNPSVTVSIESLKAGTKKQYYNLRKKIKYALTNNVTVQITSNDKGSDGNIRESKIAYNCKVSSDEAEFDPVKRTALKLEFKGESMREWVDGKEI